LDDAGLLFADALLQTESQGGAYVVYPGDPDRSTLFHRLADLAPPLHMPPLGTAELNHSAIDLMKAWITGDTPNHLTYDSWDALFFPDISEAIAAPQADADGDGLTNEAEFLLGESPVDPVVNWRPQMRVAADGSIRVRYLRLADRCFTVESLNGLSDPRWQPIDVPENAPFYGATDEWTEFTLPSDQQTGFFRVTVTAFP
jgi:hypothetical protein